MSGVIKGYFTNLSSPDDARVVTVTSVSGNKTALDVSIAGSTGTITGDVNVRAPTGPFLVQVVTIGLVAVNPLPAPLSARVSLSIRNKSTTGTLYFKESNTVTADDSATGGWEIGPGEDFTIDIDDNNTFYLISNEAGVKAKIIEIAST